MKKIAALALYMLAISLQGNAQKKDSVALLLHLSIESLMNIPIYSASKSPEPTFEAPLSSTVITKEQIKRAGCTSIMEALRLVPGVIVREQTNGNYDIHLRGLDNIPPNASLIFFTSSTTLVMIDNYPVYNYLHGGTFWETLPVDINDVEKIEVVRGPSAALYGPNAVSGVINILTRRLAKEGLYAVANARYGSYHSAIANAAAGYNFKNKISAVISGNFQNRHRTQTSYYDEFTNQYVPLDSVRTVKIDPTGSVRERYPHPNLAMRKYALNGSVNYDPTDKIQFAAALGAQHSEVQKAFGADTYAANLTTANSDTRYANIKGNINNCMVQVSYLNGTQAPVVGPTIWRWKFNTLDAVLEYKISKIRNLTLTPALIYRRAVYDDSKYVNTDIKEGFWSGRAESITKGVSLRADYKLLDQKLRLVAGGRADKFNYPDKTYFSYQLAATYKIDDRHLIRVVHSKANRAPLIIDLFSNLDLTGILPTNQTYLLEIRGNKNIKLLSSTLFEAGYRLQLTENIKFDIELSTTKTRNFSYTIFENGTFNATGPVGFHGLLDLNNITVYAKQWGGTFAANIIAGSLQLKPFITLQKTMLYDYSAYAFSPQAPPLPANNYNPALYNIYSGIGTKMKHTATPSCYGGAYINWNTGRKLNINLNPWFYTSHTELHSSNLTYNDGIRGIENIEGKLMLNAAISWLVTNKLTLTLTGRNCFNNGSREFYKADSPALMVFGGAHFEW
ncbi:TonB-dependent receptor plug domain-containing protein [Niastella sp. OAS944]|uniref:TonB-dependent receptor plug domain-containing protein n=1 Tax=Niastella sp. OAS944 TaxID=2664089 RepID=UPI003476FEF0|nr:iron complex outermembrane receptor protein [Chitinophagaceae bacterium OAS944]